LYWAATDTAAGGARWAAQVGAHVAAALAMALQAAAEEERSQSAANLVQTLCRCCVNGLLPCGVIYGMLKWLHADLAELHVSLTLTTLRVVGAKLRKDDPRGMKGFIESLQVSHPSTV
jgi:sulfite exporter TauE/SafE